MMCTDIELCSHKANTDIYRGTLFKHKPRQMRDLQTLAGVCKNCPPSAPSHITAPPEFYPFSLVALEHQYNQH